jgi:hypothetical protein
MAHAFFATQRGAVNDHALSFAEYTNYSLVEFAIKITQLELNPLRCT